jgi:MvaI/BcnI restriction endonuclease family
LEFLKANFMTFQTTAQLLARFVDLGAERVFVKNLSENDNSKQQIYLGGSFEVLSFFPHGEITAYPELKTPNFKATLDLYWLEVDSLEKAPGAQLILYPAYPEVRLSGFLAGCKSAPSEHLRQVPKDRRCGKDGRMLVFGTTKDKRIFAHLAPAESTLANELLGFFSNASPSGVFLELTLPVGSDQNKLRVLKELRQIHTAGFHESCKMNSDGLVLPYAAANGGGFTLEALLGIRPNSKAEPDYLGWEIKSHSSSRVTLMTPEPKGGFYGEEGAKAFVERYGHVVKDGGMYFTGGHKVGERCNATGLTMQIAGYDPLSRKLFDVNGAVVLLDATGFEAANWGFAELLTHWNRKHAFAAYVNYTREKSINAYRYNTPVLMGQHTDFERFLHALSIGAIIFDPGSKVTNANTAQSKIKARSQFRVSTKNLGMLYQTISTESIS